MFINLLYRSSEFRIELYCYVFARYQSVEIAVELQNKTLPSTLSVYYTCDILKH